MKVLILSLVLAAALPVYSQTEKIFFLKNSGEYVQHKDEADFIRVVNEPDSTSALYKINEFYPNNIRKLIGSASVYWPKVIWEGPSISYDKAGQKVKQVTYQNNLPVGSAYYYYPTGKVMKELFYYENGVKMSGKKNPRYKLLNYFDSTGVQLVKDGTGFMKETLNKYNVEEGNYVNGERDGVWKGLLVNTGTYEEIYKAGEFISGKNFRSDGKIIEYTIKETLPKFPGGEKAFGQFLSGNMKYPLEAKNFGISGQVLLSFVVEKDGKLTEVKVLKSPHSSLDEEALRILRRSPRWEPGIQHGVPVRVQYTLPITFRL